MSKTARKRGLGPVSAPQEQKRAVSQLSEALHDAPGTVLRLVTSDGADQVLPESVAALLTQVVHALASGASVAVVPVGRELTTQQAADLLNVSRQYMVRLLDAGEIPHHKTGTHRRVRAQALLDYKARRDVRRSAALDHLAALTQDAGGYQEFDRGG